MSQIEPRGPAAEPVRLDDPRFYINRELSLLEFHKRVLANAIDSGVPLLERLRFLTISCAILDEFVEVRVAGLRQQLAFGLTRPEPDGMGPQETLARVGSIVSDIIGEQYRVLNEHLLPALEGEGIVVFRRGAWPERVDRWVERYFRREVLPVLTPVGLDPAHPFPRILNKSLNFIVSLDGKDAFGRQSRGAVVQAPRILPRLIALPGEVACVPHGFVLLSSVIHGNVGELFPGMTVTGCHQFRVTRNSDLWVDEEEVEDLLLALKGELPQRQYGDAVRLEVSETAPPETSQFLLDQFELGPGDLFRVNGPVNLHRLEALYDLVDRPDLKFPYFVPGLPAALELGTDPFRVLRERDIVLHHPFQSFTPVVDFVSQAASDPAVLAIKMTLYRCGPDSPVGDALVRAAEAGKEVTAVVELRARFDEAANIELASRLQKAGARVVYGIVGFKAHAKMLLVVRREPEGIARYVHLGTGNYNARTARSYTDLGLMTNDRAIGEEVQALFQQLTGLGRVEAPRKIVPTPFGLHELLLARIAAEEAAAAAGRKSGIIAKMNALVEPKLIQALYRASQAGVPIDLIVRGICCLRPGLPGVSENIRVRSVVGRFLEHHRVFWFHADGDEVLLCSSADWMPRNFFRRVEVTFPIEGLANRRRVFRECLEVYLEDTADSWEMRDDGTYERAAAPDRTSMSAQRWLLQELAKVTG